jgi:LysR family transcriptional regulator, nitrogen assimilation regulatory protein
MSIDLKAFRYFSAIARAGSFSRAAEQLHVAQPALSVHIRNLEEELGLQLFVRTARGVMLTPEGERFLGSANDVLRHFDLACESARKGATEASGEVAIGMPQSLAKILTTRLVQRSLSQMPNVRLKVVEMNTGYVAQFLNSGVIDLGITFLADLPGFQYRHLVSERLCVIGPPRAFRSKDCDAERDLPRIAMADLGKMPFILPAGMHSLRQLLDGHLKKLGLKLKILAEVNSIPQLVDLAREGVGYSILAYSSVKEDICANRISGALIDNPPIVRKAFLCRAVTTLPTRAAMELESLVVRISRELVRSDGWPATMPSDDT